MNEPTGYTALDLVGYTDRGDYDPTATYVKNDLVNSGDTKWRCKVDDTIGVTPTEGVNWTAFIQLPADTTKQIIAPVEVTPSQHAYQIGKQLIFNSTLYTVISPIAVNDALVVGTNIQASDTVIEQVDNNALNIRRLKDALKKSGSYNLCSNERMYTQIIDGTLSVTFNPTGYPKGCIRLQGYVSSGKWITINYRTMKLITGQTYRLLGAVGGGTGTYRLRYYDSVNQTAVYDGEVDFVCGDSETAELAIYVNSTGASASNPIDTVLYPMITADLTATVADYVPFIDDDEYGSGIADYITPITSGNNIETNNCSVDAIGKLRVFHLSIKFSANATGTITIATAKAGSKPISLISFVEVSGTTAKSAYIDIDGNIKLDNPIAGWHSGTLAYLAKD